jgi:hypothetical protein
MSIVSSTPVNSTPAGPDPDAPRWRLGNHSDRAIPHPVVTFVYCPDQHECCAGGCRGQVEAARKAVITMPGDRDTDGRMCFCVRCLTLPDDQLRAKILQNARGHYVDVFRDLSAIHPRSVSADDKLYMALSSSAELQLGIIGELLLLAEGFEVRPDEFEHWIEQVPGVCHAPVRDALRQVVLGSAT